MENIDAIYDEDLSSFLEKAGELEEIIKGNRLCKMCGTPISLKNIQFIIPHKNEPFEYICELISCVEKYYENQ